MDVLRMHVKNYATAVSFTIMVVFFMLIFYISTQHSIICGSQRGVLERNVFDMVEYKRQRNNLSRLLNLRHQLIGQMACQTNTTNIFATKTTEGWCANSSAKDSGRLKTDKALIPTLADIFTGKAVASFGDGPGRYKQWLLETGKLRSYDAFDGAPFAETMSEGRVKFLDLTVPQYGLPVYDWVLCLEVAEHIPQQYDINIIDNIVRHAKAGVIITWTLPSLNGDSDFSNRTFKYMNNLFENSGFKYNQLDSLKLKNAASLGYLKSNLNVYRRVYLNKEDDFKRLQNA